MKTYLQGAWFEKLNRWVLATVAVIGTFFVVSATWISATEDPVVSSWVDPENVRSTRAQRVDIRAWLSWLVPVDVVPGAYVAAEERTVSDGRPRRPVLRASLPQLAAGGELVSLGGTPPEEEGEVVLPPPGSGYVVEFALDQDGLGFRNYGSRFPEGDLTADDVRSLFGDQVCVEVEGEICTPTPAAQIWIDTMTDYMRAGHCAGFTVSASRFRLGELTPVEFIPDAQHPFEIDQNVPIMRQIARDWVLQVTPEVSSQAVTGTPRQIIDSLLEKKSMVDLGIFSRSGGGHSVLAYGVEDQGEGLFHILIYDNNWPGQPLYVEVNYLANTWRYSLAATDPSQDAGAWDGDARTRSLMYVPFEAYLQPVSCPFCPA
jgi:hypothetical protein